MRPTWTSAGNLQTVLLGLASGGVCLAAVSPRRRCALTAPFHPCLCETHVKSRHRRCVSVALSRGFPRVGLPTTSPCDVRTFLDGLSLPPRLLGLAPDGVCPDAPRHRDAGALLPHHFTFACARLTCGRAIGRVFLWHFPAGFPGWALPTAMPFGVRTFLEGFSLPPRSPGPQCKGYAAFPVSGSPNIDDASRFPET